MAEPDTSSSSASYYGTGDKESGELLLLRSQNESLQISYSSLQSKFSEVVEERDALKALEKELLEERGRMQSEPKEKNEKVRAFEEDSVEIESIKECLVKISDKICGERNLKDCDIGERIETGVDGEIKDFSVGVKAISKLVNVVEYKFSEYESEKIRVFSKNRGGIELVKGCLLKVIESIDGELIGEMRDEMENEHVDEIVDFSVGVKQVTKLAITVESKLREYMEAMEKEKREKIRVSSENSVAIKSIKDCLNRVIDGLGGEINDEMSDEVETELIEEIEDFSLGLKEVSKLVNTTESKLSKYIEAKEKEKIDNVNVLLDHFQKIKSAKECLVRLLESIDEEYKLENAVNQNEETKDELETKFSEECNAISNVVIRMEMKLGEYREMREKEKRELESSVVSLTEENRDINTLLRVALAEKEAVERSLNRLKGTSETKRGAIWGLPRVGFGFMMGTSEQVSDNSSVKSDSSECDEEVESLASTVERIMKNLRLEITQLRRSLEESRSDNERLQSLAEKQAHIISENELYIKEMEDRETMLTQNVEELLVEIKESEKEVARWREACELEVEAGKRVVEERDKLVVILKQALEKTKAALEIANGKLKLKEDLANAAMAAQAACERSLQLTDSRVLALNARVEELTKQLEKAEDKGEIRSKVRHICWPFRAFNVNIGNGRARNFKRMLPEMQALLH